MVGSGSVLKKIVSEIAFLSWFSTNHFGTLARGASSVCSSSSSRTAEPLTAALFQKESYSQPPYYSMNFIAF